MSLIIVLQVKSKIDLWNPNLDGRLRMPVFLGRKFESDKIMKTDDDGSDWIDMTLTYMIYSNVVVLRYYHLV